MTIEHKDITDPNIHEPKGINTASINTFYKANGAGAGVWSKIPTQGLSGLSGNGSANQTIGVDGLGNQIIFWGNATGGIYYNNIGTPYTITYPSVYTKVAATTSGFGNPIEFSEGASGSLIYTGIQNRQAEIHISACVSQASGANRDIRFAIYKNGSIISPSESIVTSSTADKKHISTFVSTSLVTNDVIEAYIRNEGVSGDISIYTFKIEATASLM